MRTYHIFRADTGNGNFETMAIEDQALDDNKPKEFFSAGAKNIRKEGEITVEGDVEDMLDDNFSVKAS